MVSSTRLGSQALNLRLSGELAAELQRHARSSRRTVTAAAVKLLGRALADQRAYDEWKIMAVKLGLADAKAGRTIPHAEVVTMLERARARRVRKKTA